MPERQVPAPLSRVVVAMQEALAAPATDVAFPRPFQVDADEAPARLLADLFYANHTIALNPEQRCEIIWLHLRRPPCPEQQEVTASGALFSNAFLTHTIPA